MKDNYGREINYMRISLTDRCNLRCKYCVPADGEFVHIPHEDILSFEEIIKISEAAAKLGIKKIRLTGGEPLVRKGVVGLVKQISEIEGIEEIVMTTNGILLGDMAKELKEAGLTRVNISLDTMDPERFRDMTRGGDLEKVLKGIDAAFEAGLTPIKINAVAIRGYNDDEFAKFAEMTKDKPVSIRFIELMPIGHATPGDNFGFISGEEIREMIPGLEPVENEKYTVADNYKFPGAQGSVGFISALSQHFCGECNRIRLTSDGRLKPCLHSNEEIDITEALRGGDPDAISKVLENTILHKPAHHLLNEGAAPIEREMTSIGG